MTSTEKVPLRSAPVSQALHLLDPSLTIVSDQVNQDVVAKLLRNHNGYGFCKGFCPAYQPQKPVTETNLKTFTKLVTVTSSVVPAPATITLTATGEVPADSTVLQTTTISETATTTVTDAPTTVSDVQTVSFQHFIR